MKLGLYALARAAREVDAIAEELSEGPQISVRDLAKLGHETTKETLVDIAMQRGLRMAIISSRGVEAIHEINKRGETEPLTSVSLTPHERKLQVEFAASCIDGLAILARALTYDGGEQ